MRRDRYGLLKAAELAAEMVGRYERNMDCALELRVETLDASGWDDIYQLHSDRADRWQVKRQIQPLPVKDVRQLIAGAAALPHDPPTSLHLGLARFAPSTAKGAQAWDWARLAALCSDARAPGLVPADFAQTCKDRPEYVLVEQCHIDRTPSAVVATLKRLHLDELGLEEVLQSKAAEHLRDLFQNPEEVVRKIHDWLCGNPDGRARVTVNLLYEQVVTPAARRHQARPTWIYLERDDALNRWGCQGPLQLSQIVDTICEGGGFVSISIRAQPLQRDAASASLARLFLQHSPRCATSVGVPAEWHDYARTLCGGTLGLSADWTHPDLSPLRTHPAHPARESPTEAEVAAQLNDRMDHLLWTEYVEAVERHLHEDEIESNLQSAMRAVWAAWLGVLGSTPQRAAFLHSTLATADEGNRPGFDARTRSGPRIRGELVRATTNALAIAAAFEAGGVQTTPAPDKPAQTLLLGAVPAHVVALTVASHPETRRPYLLCDHPGVTLGMERGITILATISESTAALYRVAAMDGLPYHVADAPFGSYSRADPPCPLLTASADFRLAVRQGLPALRQHLADTLGAIADSRASSLAAAVQKG